MIYLGFNTCNFARVSVLLEAHHQGIVNSYILKLGMNNKCFSSNAKKLGR